MEISSNISYSFCNSQFNLLSFYHIYGVPSCLVNISGIFIVWKKGYPGYREHLLFHLIWSAIFDVSVSFLTSPKLHNPYFLVEFNGFLNFLWIPASLQAVLILFIMHMVICSCGHICLYRAHGLLIPGMRLKLSKRNFRKALIFWYSLVLIPFFIVEVMKNIEQNLSTNVKIWLEENPKFLCMRIDPSFAFYENDAYLSTKVHKYYLFSFSIYIFISIVGSFLLIFYQVTHNSQSLRSRAQLKKTLIGILSQLIPIFFLYGIPGIYLALTIPFGEPNGHNQVLNDASVALLTLQGSGSVICALLFNKEYRLFMFGRLPMLKPKSYQTTEVRTHVHTEKSQFTEVRTKT